MKIDVTAGYTTQSSTTANGGEIVSDVLMR